MCLGAIAFTVWPLARDLPRQGLLSGIAVVAVAALSAGIYATTGSPGVPSKGADGASEPDVEEMVASLASRLEKQPDDVNGWLMLGRSYMTLGNYPEATRAYERAVALEDAQNAQTLVSLGESLLAGNGQQMTPGIISIFENALALEPSNPSALFWGGLGAAARGDTSLAATRWELLLSTDPPVEVRGVIEQRIGIWRGTAAPAEPATAPMERAGPVVAASISVDGAAAAALPAEATVFVIARDPAQPSPPIAVTRRQLSELPAVIELGDSDSMIPGRSLSGFPEFELVARVSLSGSPAAQPGDWFGAMLVRPADGNQVQLAISEQVK